jgi:endoglucanase
LAKNKVNASFFLTGRFYDNPNFKKIISKLKKNGNYLGAHSNDHLLYADWKSRNTTLVSKAVFTADLNKNYLAMERFGVKKQDAKYFLPPYEWYNQEIANWTTDMGLQLVNFTPGTRSTADYTYPEMGSSYRSNDEIYQSILNYEKANANGLNGFMLLLHIGTDPRRTEKLYNRLPELIKYLKDSGYELVKINELLDQQR